MAQMRRVNEPKVLKNYFFRLEPEAKNKNFFFFQPEINFLGFKIINVFNGILACVLF